MKKSLTEKVIYKPNLKVTVTVTNKPVFDDDGDVAVGYDRTVSISIKAGFESAKLAFVTDEDIEKFIETVEFGDPQQALELSS